MSAREIPRLLLICDRFVTPARRDVILEVAAESAIPWCQLRDHDAGDDSLRKTTSDIVEWVGGAKPGLVVSINNKVDLAQEFGLGLHVGFRGPTAVSARTKIGSETLLGISAHDVDELTPEILSAVDYVMVSPVFDSVSKVGLRGRGVAFLEQMVARSSKPVIALGGIKPTHMAECLSAGAHGVAVLGGILEADNPVAAANDYVEALARLPYED